MKLISTATIQVTWYSCRGLQDFPIRQIVLWQINQSCPLLCFMTTGLGISWGGYVMQLPEWWLNDKLVTNVYDIIRYLNIMLPMYRCQRGTLGAIYFFVMNQTLVEYKIHISLCTYEGDLSAASSVSIISRYTNYDTYRSDSFMKYGKKN